MSSAARSKSHKEWRKEYKKFRRKQLRQKNARVRCQIEEQARKLQDETCLAEASEVLQKEAAEKELQEQQHDAWLRRELLAQKSFREEQKRKKEIDKVKEQERSKILMEFEKQKELSVQREKEINRQVEEKHREHQDLLERIRRFVDEGEPIPEFLYERAETNPRKMSCPFYEKTATCRYGGRCTNNHSKPRISKTLLFPHFFTHILLDQAKGNEYGNDLTLEYCEDDLEAAYVEFFQDVTEEMCKFGQIINFRVCRNHQSHLRGNVFVEFENECSAMRAYQKLQGRYYGGRRINCEFCEIRSWNAAICGLSIANRCHKGRNCNFLHLLKNPGNKFEKLPISTRKKGLASVTRSDRELSWNDIDDPKSSRAPNRRWSESPEPLERVSSSKSTSKVLTDTKSNKIQSSTKPRSRSRSRMNSTDRRNSRSHSHRRRSKRSHADGKKIKKSRSKSRSEDEKYKKKRKRKH